MSASSKKKLRKEQEAVKLTEKQLTAQKEAKKTNLYTIAFVAVLAVLLVVAIWVGISQTIANSGVRERNTTALTVGDHKISNAELSYFYISAVNNFYSQYGSYASWIGLDLSKPLNEQILDETTGQTWADDLLDTAKANARAAYAMADAAEAAGFVLPESEIASIENSISTMKLYATLYGYSDTKAYLKAMYGNGSTEESYREFLELTALADAYYSYYAESLTYDESDLRAVDAENYGAYSSYTYNAYYMAASKFLEGGTTDENGSTTYSDEEKAASVTAAEEAAKALTGEDITSVAGLDAAIAALPFNADTEAASTAYTDVLYSTVSTTYAEWLSDESRQEGDKAYFASSTTSTDEDGNETTTINGYYVVYYTSTNDNTFPLSNVRHILAAFEGGTTDETTGSTTYSDEEKAAAKAEAEQLLAEWEAGDATEDSFAELANTKSDDGDGTTGGLYENISPQSNYVTNFKDWALEDHEPGDTGIVETEYGYHVMYYVGDTAYTYRDYLIETQLRSADLTEWYNTTVDAMTSTDGSFKYIRMDLVLSSS